MDYPQVVIKEMYIDQKQHQRAALALTVGERLMEMSAFRSDAERLAQAFPWVKDSQMAFYLGRFMTRYIDTPFLAMPSWPSDWRECAIALKDLTSRWGLDRWQDGFAVVAKAVSDIANGISSFSFGGSWWEPEAKSIRIQLKVTYYTWGWDRLRKEILAAVLAEARKQYEPQQQGGKRYKGDPLILMRDVQIYLWRQQGMNYAEIRRAWRIWFWGKMRENKRRWRPEESRQLENDWLRIETLNEGQIKNAIRRVKNLLTS